MRFSLAHSVFGWCFGIVLCLAAGEIQADSGDRYSFEFQGEPLTEVLQQVAKITETDLVYDPQMVDDKVVYERIEEQTVQESLSTILGDTSLDYVTLSSGTIVIVESTEEEPGYGTFTGKVKDRRTGDPLPGATVMLADASGGTTTNQNGNFSLNRIMSGEYRIVFSYVGYEPVEKYIEVPPDEQIEEEVTLNPEPVDFSPIVITGHRPRMVGIQRDEPADTRTDWETANRPNAIRSLSLFSGVQYGLPMQDIHIQGGQQGEHRLRLDGVPMYNPYNFGQMFSAFSPMAIGSVNLHKAGYGAGEGSQIAGIIDLTHEKPADNQSGGFIQADPLSFNVRGDISSSGEENNFHLMGAFRTNYWNLYREPTLEQTLQEWDYVDPLITNHLFGDEQDISNYTPASQDSDLRFLDIHLSGVYEFDDYNTLSSSLYAGQNRIGTSHLGEAESDYIDQQYLYTRELNEWQNIMGQITWHSRISPRIDLSTQAGYSYSRMDHGYGIGHDGMPSFSNLDSGSAVALESGFSGQAENLITQEGDNRIEHLILRSDASYSISPQFNLTTGVDLNLIASTVELNNEFYMLPTRIRQNSFLSSMHLNLNYRFGSYWKLTGGSRLTYSNTNDRVYPEPRFSVQFDQTESSIGYWSAQISGGLYRQFINQFEMTNIGPTSLVPTFTVWSHAMPSDFPKAYHLSGSWITNLTDHTSLKLEGYYKWQPTAYITSHNNLQRGVTVASSATETFAETTQMQSYGAGIRFNQDFWNERLKFMLGYDYSHAEMNLESQFGRWVQASWNEPHRFQARGMARLWDDVTAVVKWQSINGRTWGYRQAYYDFLLFRGVEEAGEHNFRNPEDDRLSAFRQLDLSLIYQPEIGSANLDIRLDLINVLNRRNTIDWSLQPESMLSANRQQEENYEVRERQMPGFYPSISVEVGF